MFGPGSALTATILAGLFSIALGGFIYVVRRQVLKRAEHMMERWCAHNGFSVVSKKIDGNACFRGPFAFAVHWYRPVYKAIFQQRSGKCLHASVSFGSWLSGVFSERVIVVWDPGNSPYPIIEKRLGDELA
jgi:hypothetical protein